MHRSVRQVFVGILATVLVAGTALAGPKARINEVQRASATVEAIDQESRMVTLKNAEGETFSFKAGPEVKNLAQVKKGDVVTVDYYRAFAAEVRKADTAKGVELKEQGSRAKPGEKPAIAGRSDLTVTVKIDAVDLKQNTVSFTGPQGNKNVVDVVRPEGRAFIKQLKPGDLVDLTYTEALAVSVTPAPKK
jgi:hypothetical protein